MADVMGIIAGGGKFPLMLAEAARRQGLRVVAVAHLGETDEAMADSVDNLEWVKLGQLGKVIHVFKRAGVTRALMAGTITKKKMFSSVMPDLRALSLMGSLAVFHDDDILTAVARTFSREGIEIISSTSLLPELIAPHGVLTRRKPTRNEQKDVEFGWRMVKEIGMLDIGQCIVVRRKTVLAVEAIEGTDETIRRGGRLAVENAVVVKASKPQQDLRFDVPTVGLQTIITMNEVGASVLAIEAGRTLIFDRGEMTGFADKSGISIVSRS
jgi:UDP-2,3-diacylglucosamine hydrolase